MRFKDYTCPVCGAVASNIVERLYAHARIVQDKTDPSTFEYEGYSEMLYDTQEPETRAKGFYELTCPNGHHNWETEVLDDPYAEEPERNTTTCAGCEQDFPDAEMIPLDEEGELCPLCAEGLSYIIRTDNERDEDGRAVTLYWNNETGWGDRASATYFTEEDTETLPLPIGGRWWSCRHAPKEETK